MQVQTKAYTEGKQKRTPHEQAIFETKAVILKKKREGWTQEEDSAATAGSVRGEEKEERNPVLEIRPLLARSFETKLVAGPCFVQPKLDGMRCIADIETGTLWSRGGKVITELPRLQAAVKALYGFTVRYLDGELYVPGKTFSELVSLVRNGADLEVQYFVYDCVMSAPFSTRHGHLQELFCTAPLVLVPTLYTTADQIEGHHLEFLRQGFEGTMVRTDKELTYRQGARSSSLLKLKNFQDQEFLCTGVKQEKHEDTLGSLECVTGNGQVFNARPKLSDEERLELWRHPERVVNHWVTVKYFEITDAGVPRFPVVTKLRPLQDLPSQ